MNKRLRSRAILSVVLTFVFYLAFLLLQGLFLPETTPDNLVTTGIITLAIAAIMAGACYSVIRTTKIFDKPFPFKDLGKPYAVVFFLLILGLFMFLGIGENVVATLSSPPATLANAVMVSLSAGLFEEFLVRLLCFAGLLYLLRDHRYSITLTTVISSVLFGLMHFSNLGGAEPIAVVQQVFYAAALGLVFAILRVLSNGLVLPVLVHMLVDFQPTIGTSGPTSTDWLVLAAVFVPAIVACIALLMRMDKVRRNSDLQIVPFKLSAAGAPQAPASDEREGEGDASSDKAQA